MHRSKKICITDINQYIICSLCKGYYIDATTISECLHTFCKTCIVKYLQTNKYCPTCDVLVHKNKPLLSLRPDQTVQDLVYKLVPRLLQNEIRRRRDFYESNSESKSTNNQDSCGEFEHQHLFTPEEILCLTLNYYGNTGPPRYLRCPAAVTIGHLHKLIRAKYDLTDNHRIDVLFNQDCLNDSLTLMDIGYIYSWKRKGPIQLTYKIYEYALKRLKLTSAEVTSESPPIVNNVNISNNNNWKEVQLRISENGEMSIVQDSITDFLNNDTFTSDVITVVESKNNVAASKSGVPSKEITSTSTAVTTIFNNGSFNAITSSCIANNDDCIKPVESIICSTATISDSISTNTVVNFGTSTSTINSTCMTFSTDTTTMVFSTINNTKCSVSESNDSKIIQNCVTADVIGIKEQTNDKTEKEKTVDNIKTQEKEIVKKVDKSTTNVNTGAEVMQGTKRKLDTPVSLPEQSPKIRKQNLLHNLSNNHPLKKHSQLNKISENPEVIKNEPKVLHNNLKTTVVTSCTTNTSTITKQCSDSLTFTKPTLNKYISNLQSVRPGTPITNPKQPVTKYQPVNQPCYMPKTSYSPIINVPKIQPSTSAMNSEVRITSKSDKVMPSVSLAQTAVSINNKLNIKAKSNTPLGYKTLRDPPKSWNSQISKANISKPIMVDQNNSDLKTVRPPKFFKMRNNLPRYLGNPASGVKPMYQVHISPDKGNSDTMQKVEKSEIKKHSIVKIDPKTLKPISEKAPETTSLSNQSDLIINTSSVPIFNPLKLQSSPKSAERKSPKSPHSPKLKSVSPPNKRDKLNLNFTPSNPFIPNLASPTVSPNQFLYSSGPPGFPSYDPRVVAAYHHLLYGQRLPFPTAPLPGLSLDLNQRNFDMGAPSSPKIGSLSQPHSPQAILPAHASIKTSQSCTKSNQLVHKNINSISSSVTSKPQTITKKTTTEKSLQNAVDKLTQNRAKEIVKSETITNNNSVKKNIVVHEIKSVELILKNKVEVKEKEKKVAVESKSKEEKSEINSNSLSTNNKKEIVEVEKKSDLIPTVTSESLKTNEKRSECTKPDAEKQSVGENESDHGSSDKKQLNTTVCLKTALNEEKLCDENEKKNANNNNTNNSAEVEVQECMALAAHSKQNTPKLRGEL